MASSEDYQKILDRYNQEVKNKGISIVQFCAQNGIVYANFERWFKNRRKPQVHEVRIVNSDAIQSEETKTPELPREESAILFSIQIKTSFGMCIKHTNIDYPKLKQLVEKLEALC